MLEPRVAHGVVTPGPMHKSFAPECWALATASHWDLSAPIVYGTEHKLTLTEALEKAIREGFLRPTESA
jgi:hypothetical protein